MFLIFLNTKLHFFFDKSDKKTKKKLKRKEASLAGSLLERWLELRYNEVDFFFGITVLRYYGISFFRDFPFFRDYGITVLRYFPFFRDYGITGLRDFPFSGFPFFPSLSF